jgi:hypothetical protein
VLSIARDTRPCVYVCQQAHLQTARWRSIVTYAPVSAVRVYEATPPQSILNISRRPREIRKSCRKSTSSREEDAIVSTCFNELRSLRNAQSTTDGSWHDDHAGHRGAA